MLLKRVAGRCGCCGVDVEVEVPGVLAKGALVAGYVGLGALGCLVGALGPYMVMGVPVLMAGGMGAVLPLHAWASHEATCPACGKLWTPAVVEKSAARALVSSAG